ncbi:MAG: FapA family protein [bacterium]|nr:FapA family protein [bacterium]
MTDSSSGHSSIKHAVITAGPPKLMVVQGDVLSEHGTVHFDGNIKVEGNVMESAHLSATGDIEVKGQIRAAIIKADERIIAHTGFINCAKEECVAGTAIIAGDIIGSRVSCNGDILVKNRVIESEIRAKGRIYVGTTGTNVIVGEGLILGGSVESDIEIWARTVGNATGKITTLKVKEPDQSPIFERILEIDKRILETKKDIAKIERTENILKVLGDRISTLPAERKKEILKEVRKGTEVRSELVQLEIKKTDLEKQMKKWMSGERPSVVVSELVYPGTEVVLHVPRMAARAQFFKRMQAVEDREGR